MSSYTWKINPKQREFLSCTEPEVLYSGGARSGKSVSLCLKAAKEAAIPGNVVIIARKWFSTLRASTLVTLLDGTAPYPPVLPLGTYTHNRSEHVIKIHGGGTIRYIGISDDIQKIRSMAAGAIFIDECSEISEEDWVELSLRLCLPCGCQQIMGATNPSSQSHWLYRRFVIDNSDRKRFISTTARDNELNLPKRTMENLRALTGSMKQRMLEGEWCASEKFLYPDVDKCIVDKLPAIEAIKSWYIGVDYGFTNPTAFTLAGRDGEGVFWFYDAYERSGMMLDEIKKWLVSKKDKDPTIFVDPSAASLIADLMANRFRAVKAINDVALGVDRFRDEMARGRVRISVGCQSFIRSLRGMMYGTDGKPIKKDDHLHDSGRYLISTVIDQENGAMIDKMNAPKSFYSIN